MTRISLSEIGDTPFQKLLGHNPPILENWKNLEYAVLNYGQISPNIKEQVRRVLAFANQCFYCMSFGEPDKMIQDPKTAVAMTFARKVAIDHLTVSDQDFDELKKWFTDAEISELCAFICFFTASQKCGSIMNLLPACPN